MKTIFLLSLRNLVRQKRKNLLLGAAIAFGTLTLITATSFVNGITDTLFNRVIVYMTGHIELHLSENGSQYYSINRDTLRMKELIRKNVTGIKSIEENVSVFTRGIGNGKSDNLILIGLAPDISDFLTQFKVIEGNAADFSNPAIENPMIISEPKAKYLRVKTNDLLRVRLRTINGQQQTAVMRIVAIVKSTNMFLDATSYGRLADIKSIMGYRPYETGSLQVILNDPMSAPIQADRLHKALTSPTAWIPGKIDGAIVWVGGFKRDSATLAQLRQAIRVVSGTTTISKHTVLVSRPFAEAHNIRLGSELPLAYPARLESATGNLTLTVTGIYEPTAQDIGTNVILAREDLILSDYYRLLPKLPAPLPKIGRLATLLVPEWTLLDRTHTSEEYKKKNQELGRLKLKNGVLDVRTMVETASTILTFDAALRIITYSAVTLLFIIILIGIVNSLRMNIRERTREIGTMRAIGMHQRQILSLFVLESFFLALFASLVGLVAALLLMGGLSLIPIMSQTPLNIFLVDHHLFFLAQWGTILINLSFIVVITVIAAYFPARTAAYLECADALRHSEG
jgi:ABC-type lipoprotein release transport system permease subunit